MFDFAPHVNRLLSGPFFGEAVIITTTNGTVIAIDQVGFKSQTQTVGADGDATEQLQEAIVLIRLDDLSLEPERGWTVLRVATGESWTVSDAQKLSGRWQLSVHRAAPVAKVAGQYHRGR